jgi:hypothetical protein
MFLSSQSHRLSQNLWITDVLSQYVTNAKYLINSWNLRWNPHSWSPVISPTYGVNLETKSNEYHFACSWWEWHPSIITIGSFIIFFKTATTIDSFHCCGNSHLIPNRIKKYVDLRTQYITSRLDYFCQYLIYTCRYISFQLFNKI